MCDLINEDTYEYDIFYKINKKIYVENILTQSGDTPETFSDRNEKEFLESDTFTKLNIIFKGTSKFEIIQTEKLRKEAEEELRKEAEPNEQEEEDYYKDEFPVFYVAGIIVVLAGVGCIFLFRKKRRKCE